MCFPVYSFNDFCVFKTRTMSRKAVNYEAILPEVPFTDTPIPKHIHQIFLGKSAHLLPEEMQANIQHLQNLNPEWEYHLWRDEDVEPFILKYYNKEILRYFRMISPMYRAAQADFLRYLLTYSIGGIYLDIKSTILKPLDETLLPSDRFILYHWDNEGDGPYKGYGFYPDLPRSRFPYGEFPQTFIISSPGHPILRAVILDVLSNLDSYSPFRTDVGLWGVLRTTGPIAYSLAVERVTRELPARLYRHVRCIEDLGMRVSIYGTATGHRKAVPRYGNLLTAVSLNGSQRYTKYMYGYFLGRRVFRILRDKVRMALE